MSTEQIHWAMLGLNGLGWERCESIARDPRSTLVAAWGCDRAELDAPRVATSEEAISLADAVAVHAPVDARAALVRAALVRARHVAVVAPLAPDAATARELVDLAAAVERVLHVSHLEVFDGPAHTLRAQTYHRSIRAVQVVVERNGPLVDGAQLAEAALAPLHRVFHFAGRVGSVDAVQRTPGQLHADLTLHHGGSLELTVRQAPDFAPTFLLEVDDASSGRWRQAGATLYRGMASMTLLEAKPPWREDHAAAVRCILDGARPVVPPLASVHGLDLVARLRDGVTGSVGLA